MSDVKELATRLRNWTRVIREGSTAVWALDQDLKEAAAALTALQAERDAAIARAEAAEENVGILRASREALEAQVAQLQRELAKARSLGPGTKAEARADLKGNNND